MFPPPVPPGDHALAAADAAYSMAPYVLGPDEALVMTARWPDVPLRERLALEPPPADLRLRAPHRRRSNRAQTRLDPDGSFTRGASRTATRGVPNWLDTEGRPFGLVFWRFFLPEGPIDTPQAEVVNINEL